MSSDDEKKIDASVSAEEVEKAKAEIAEEVCLFVCCAWNHLINFLIWCWVYTLFDFNSAFQSLTLLFMCFLILCLRVVN